MPRAMMSRSNTDVRHRFFCRRRIVDTREAGHAMQAILYTPIRRRPLALAVVARASSCIVITRSAAVSSRHNNGGRKMQRIQGAESGRERRL
jgi:hypothetical protein